MEHLRILYITFLLTLTSCTLAPALTHQQAAVESPTIVPTVVPTSTPAVTTGSLLSNAQLAQIDASGLDFVERRIIDVYDRVSPSVVNITTEVLRRNFFFDIIPEEGAGSGFVLDEEGHILTNYHVVRDASRVEVNFSQVDPATGLDTEIVLDAQIIGVDQRNDIAVLEVDAPAGVLVPVTLGTSAGLQVGQRAVAIGNPFGQFGRTLTTGVISAVDRTLEGPDKRAITGIIQTDAAINRGNSGGPLLDSSGRVIGVNTAIFSPSGASAGVGFAVPIDTVRRVLPDLLALGRYRHPWLGIRYAYSLTPSLAQLTGISVDRGLLLVQLYDNSPLDRAGLVGAQQEAILGNQRIYLGGDIVQAIDGVDVMRVETLETFLEDNYRVGDSVTVTYLRDGIQGQVVVELVEEQR